MFLTKVTDLLSDRTDYRDGTASKKTETREGGLGRFIRDMGDTEVSRNRRVRGYRMVKGYRGTGEGLKDAEETGNSVETEKI